MQDKSENCNSQSNTDVYVGYIEEPQNINFH